MGLHVGAAVADAIQAGQEGGHRAGHLLEVVKAVLPGDVGVAAENPDDGFLLHLGQAGLVVAAVEEAAVHDHDGLDAGVVGHVEGLQTAAGHAGRGDIVDVKLAVIGAVLVGVLGDCPFESLLQAGRIAHRHSTGHPAARHSATAHPRPFTLRTLATLTRTHLRHSSRHGAGLAGTRAFQLLIIAGADGDNQEALGRHFIQEVDMAAGRVGAAAVSPDQDGERVVLAESAEILRAENGVRGQGGFLHHNGLIRAGTAFLEDSRFRRLGGRPSAAELLRGRFGISEDLGVHPFEEIRMALGSDGAAAVVGGLDIVRALLLGQGDRVIKNVAPGEVSHQSLAGIVDTLDILEHRHPHILSAGLHQTLEGGNAVGLGVDGRVVVGLDDPDVLLGKRLDIIVRDVHIHICLAGGIGRREVLGVADQHMHGHVAAIRTAANINALAVHIRMPVDIIVDA